MTSEESVRLAAPEAARGVLDAVRSGESVALMVIVEDPDGFRRSRRLLVTPSHTRGSLGDPGLDAAGRALARRALAPEGEEVEEGVHEIGDEAGHLARVYLELHYPTPELVLVGAGHIAQPLSTMGHLLGFRVTVLDDRPDFATRERFPDADRLLEVDFDDPFAEVPIHGLSHLVLVTRGHKYDYECLRKVVRQDLQPAYIGMIGSRRRVRATWAQLMEEDIPRERIATVRAPVGLDLGAETPGEIAVAVAAEIVLQWRGGTGRPLQEKERVLERFFPEEEEGGGGAPAPADGGEPAEDQRPGPDGTEA